MFCILLYPFIFGLSYLFFKATEKRHALPLEDLKNALLIYALNTIYPEDFEKEHTVDYDSFDGTKLPSLYECFNNVSMYFNYVVEPNMQERRNAISNYLETRFQSRTDVECFFKNYTEVVDAAFETEVYVLDEELGLELDDKYEEETHQVQAPNASPSLENENYEENEEIPSSHRVEVDPITAEDDYDHVESVETKKDV